MLVTKNLPPNASDARDTVLIPGKIPYRRRWQPTSVFLPGESMDRGAWRATVHGAAKSQTWLGDCTRARTHASTHTHTHTHTLTTIYKIDNKDLLYSQGNSTQHLVITYNEKESLKEYKYKTESKGEDIRVYIYIYTESLCCILETQQSKLTRPQFKNDMWYTYKIIYKNALYTGEI